MQPLAKDCVIWTMFLDTTNPRWYQLKYCQKNCKYKCLDGKDYKKQGEKHENKRKTNS